MKLKNQMDIFELMYKSDFPCDNSKYDYVGCCDYPDKEDDYCIMGDKQFPIK